MTKRIIIIAPDGTETPLTETITLDLCSRIVGGPLEWVRPDVR